MIDGVVMDVRYSDGSNTKCYYGTKISLFFVRWRTGKIGLITMEAVGTFCSPVDISVLKYYKYSNFETA